MVLTKGVQVHNGFFADFLLCDSTGVGRVSCISSSLYSECCSLRVETISPCRYHIVASCQSCNICAVLSPNDSIQLLGDSGNNTRDGCISCNEDFLVYWLNT